jgi:hypothetical protein
LLEKLRESDSARERERQKGDIERDIDRVGRERARET